MARVRVTVDKEAQRAGGGRCQTDGAFLSRLLTLGNGPLAAVLSNIGATNYCLQRADWSILLLLIEDHRRRGLLRMSVVGCCWWWLLNVPATVYLRDGSAQTI